MGCHDFRMSSVTHRVRRRTRSAVTFVLATLAAALLGLVASPSPAAAAPALPAQSYAYDGHHHNAGAVPERGPPATYDQHARHDSVVLWSHGVMARSGTLVLTTSTYNRHTTPVQIAGVVVTTRMPAEAITAAVRSFTRRHVAANAGDRSVAIGEDMANRVEPFAKKIGADTYKADPTAPRETWMENNRTWIRKQMDDGCTIYDCGPAPGRANFRGPTSPYYKMELDELRDNPNYFRVWLGE
jgi:hypothetical protein